MEQIVDYKNDTGNGYTKTILCFLQLFIVSNRDQTFYFANNNTRHFSFNSEERFLPVYEFADVDNRKVVHLDSFAETFLENVSMVERRRAYVYFFGRLGSNGSQSRPFALPPDQSIVQVWVGVFSADANSSPLFP
jgi:type I site-specific restriction-modification system R (restriction) subunit